MSLTTIFGPLIMNNLFYFFTKDNAPIHFPGVSFLLGAVLMLISTYVAWKVLTREKKIDPKLREVIEAHELKPTEPH
jgi:DHA1 family tetracycline resistance protein-like MFS transporter